MKDLSESASSPESEPHVSEITGAQATGSLKEDEINPLATPPPSRSSSTTTDPIPFDAGSAWDMETKRTVIVIMLVVGAGLLWISRPVIPLLVVSGIVAYLLSPLVDICERVRIPRAVTTIILFVLLLFIVIVTPILLAPVLVAQLASLNFDVPSTAFQLLGWLSDTINHLPETVDLFGFEVQIAWLTEQIETSFQDVTFIPTLAEVLRYFQQLISTATNVVSSTAAIGVSVVGGILQVLITFLLVFFLSLYLTKDAPSIRAYIEGLFPRSYQSEWIDLLRRMGHVWQAFFRGQLLLSIIIGVVTWLALELAGMPGALILGILAGSLEIIPNLGPTLSMIPAVIVALIQGSTVFSDLGVNNFGFALITMAIYFIIQQLENNILVPRIIGGGVNLHPIVVLCGVVIGFNVAGILGALFAAPVIASLRILGGYIHAKLLDYPPFYDQHLPRRNQFFSYRRTVTGDQLSSTRRAPRSAPAALEQAGTEPAASRANPDEHTEHSPSVRDESEPTGAASHRDEELEADSSHGIGDERTSQRLPSSTRQ